MTQANLAPALPQAEGAHLISLFNAGRYAELETRARELAAQYPDTGFVWKVLGTALLVQGKDGVQALQRAVALVPGDVESHSNLGNMLKGQGRLDEAVASYRQAVALKPDYAAAHFNLGLVLQELQRLPEAVLSFQQAVRHQPGFADAQLNLGLALKRLGRLDEAAKSLRQAVALKRDDAEAHANLAMVLQAQGQWKEAVTSYRKALAIKPDMAAVHNNLGNVLKDQGRLHEALACYRQALAIQPEMGDAHNNLGNAFKELGQLDEALDSYRRALSINPDDTDARSNLLFTSNYVLSLAPEALLAEARAFGERVTAKARLCVDWPQDRDPERTLRVGLVSGDLCQHPVGYFLESVLRALSAQAAGRIEVLVYATSDRDDALSARLKACCSRWTAVAALSDADLAGLIGQDRIDILIDLSGHTAYNRLPMFAWKPAPVQASWLGYFATTGVPAIDYVIADPWTLPASLDGQFVERIWRLPETRMCFTPPDVKTGVSALPALANKGRLTFGCFNNLTKLNDEVVALWARVLKAVPDSRLFLKAEQLDDTAVRAAMGARFKAQGVDAHRLLLEGKSPRPAYLAAYGKVDIGLDPFPFTGGTTSVESLWMGVPVLTLAGDRMVSRQGVALMHNAGLPDWVADDADDYVAKAVLHAGDLQALARLRAGLRQQVQASPLLDAERFAGHFEAALRGMWRAWCSGAQGG